jgi:hypothetical protein
MSPSSCGAHILDKAVVLTAVLSSENDRALRHFRVLVALWHFVSVVRFLYAGSYVRFIAPRKNGLPDSMMAERKR